MELLPNKIIFSRKGFDSSAGGFPSLIFPDGSLFSIPIPASKDKYTYHDLHFYYNGDAIQSILNDLTDREIYSAKRWRPCDYFIGQQNCHYDPMLFEEEKFKGIVLGQAGSSEGHLRNQSITKGDIFLFYGWFKEVEKINGKWEFQKDKKDVHLIWSFMEVDKHIKLDNSEQKFRATKEYPFLEKHPHIWPNKVSTKNGVYKSLKYNWHLLYDDKRILTDLHNYQGRATWRLPWYFDQPQAFTYLNNFQIDNGDVVTRHRGYGQEFVLDLQNVDNHSQRNKIIEYINEICE